MQYVNREDPLPAGAIRHPITPPDDDIITGIRSLNVYSHNLLFREESPGAARAYEEESGKTYDKISNALLSHIEGWDIDLEIKHGMFHSKKVEVKSIRNFLSRYHCDDKPKLNLGEGTLYFELYSNTSASPSKGSLYSMMYPDQFDSLGRYWKVFHPKLLDPQRSSIQSQFRSTTYVAPDYIVFVLYYDWTQSPFATVSFRWDKLKEKLISLRTDLWPNWTVPPYDIVSAEPWVVQNCWHVPMYELIDIARITLITPIDRGAIGRAIDRNGWNRDLMRKRYKYLRDHRQAKLSV